MKIEITDTIRKQIAKEVIVNKAAKTAVAKKFNVSARSVGRYVEKYADEITKKEKKSSNIEDILAYVKSKVVYTRTGKIWGKPNKLAVEAYLAANGDKEQYYKYLEDKITRKAAEHGYYRCRAHLG